MYTRSARYLSVLFFIIVAFFSCKKNGNNAAVKIPSYASGIYGTRTYHDTSYAVRSSGDTSYPKSDKQVTITPVNSVTVSVFGKQLAFVSSNDTVLSYSYSYAGNSGSDYSLTAYYYHYADSIVILEDDRLGAGGSADEKWNSF